MFWCSDQAATIDLVRKKSISYVTIIVKRDLRLSPLLMLKSEGTVTFNALDLTIQCGIT